nr:MAG TPA: virion morphogenesis protein [Caudoviricetes sp.]
MVNGTATLTRSGRGFSAMLQRIERLTKKEVLVGIPQEEAARPGGDMINNAELLYLHTHGVRAPVMRAEMRGSIDLGMLYSAAHSLYVQTHGSPAYAIPPRPVLEPAIRDSKGAIGKQIAGAYRAAMHGDMAGAERGLELAGMVAQNAARGWFENPKNGWPANSLRTIKEKGSDRPLIDTGEMRKSITYVIRDMR